MTPTRYVALLRGINVGGNHKVPMLVLKKVFEKIGFTSVKTLLASGNVVFESTGNAVSTAKKNELTLVAAFGFPLPMIVRKMEDIVALVDSNPFKAVTVTKDVRLYVTFLSDKPVHKIAIPYTSEDKSFRIMKVKDNVILSVLDISKTKKGTPDAMLILEKEFGKAITTRNWNTVEKIAKM